MRIALLSIQYFTLGLAVGLWDFSGIILAVISIVIGLINIKIGANGNEIAK